MTFWHCYFNHCQKHWLQKYMSYFLFLLPFSFAFLTKLSSFRRRTFRNKNRLLKFLFPPWSQWTVPGWMRYPHPQWGRRIDSRIPVIIEKKTKLCRLPWSTINLCTQGVAVEKAFLYLHCFIDSIKRCFVIRY